MKAQTDEKKIEGLVLFQQQYPILANKTGPQEMQKLIEENLGGKITITDLVRPMWAQGESRKFDVPNLDGEKDSIPELTGIIVFHKSIRQMYPKDAPLGSMPPVCFSEDTKIGIGDPGGDCNACPFSAWGSAEVGKGQKCKMRHVVFLLQQNQFLPIMLSIPPTSLKAFRLFLQQMASGGISFYGIEMKITLQTDKSATGNPYAKGVFSKIRILNEQEKAQAESYYHSIKAMMESTQISATPSNDGEEIYEPPPVEEKDLVDEGGAGDK